MTIATVEIPTHCPLCHKALEGPINHVVLPNATTACIQCWHLTQEMIIKGMVELPDAIVNFRHWWGKWRQRLSLRYWFVDKPHYEKVAQRHSGETPAVNAEIPKELA